MRKVWNALDNIFLKSGKGTVAFMVAIQIMVLGWLDYLTGFEISFSFFYLVPILLATWYIDLRAGAGVAFVSIGIWMVSNRLAGAIYSTEIIRVWNAAIRLIVFTAVAGMIDQLKLALHKERLLASTDFLTGVRNSREFNNQAQVEIERARSLGQPLTIAYLDLDEFKAVNDARGHAEGNGLLKTIAETISESLRKSDTFARMGGDEFAILLPNTDRKSAEVVIGKVQKVVSEKMRQLASPVTLSIGMATYLKPPHSVDELISTVDGLMYKAKTDGKDRVYYKLVE